MTNGRYMGWLRSFLLAVPLVALAAIPALPQETALPTRIALVIANGTYPDAAIAQVPAQGRAVAAALREGGFEVIAVENGSRADMRQAIAQFAGKLRPGAAAVVFYSGHAVQQRDRDFLVPISPNPVQDAVDLDEIIDPLIIAKPSSALVLIDASRDNPWQARGKGLRATERLETVAVMFTASPGKTVADSGPRGNPAVEEWLKAIRTPGLDMAAAVERVRDAVAKASRRSQQIWLSSAPPKGLVVTPVGQPVAVAQANRAVILSPPGSETSPDAFELAFWESIRNSENASEYRAYLDAYPNGRFSALARAREQLYRGKPGVASPAASASRPPPAATPAAPGPKTGSIRDCSDCPELTAIPPGSFQMGSNDLYEFEKPVHPVAVRGFYLGTREVNFEEWDRCVNEGGCNYRPDDRGLGRGKRPVTDIHWNDANAYLAWLSTKTGKRYRLPSESEWEYAARAGTATTYPWGQAVEKDRANCLGCNDQPRRSAVASGQYPPNAFGLYDMAGNAAEWVADCWSENYRAAPRDGSVQVVPGCRERVLRGGSFNNDPRYLRSAARFKYEADVRFYTNGFRVAREP
ncbi:SUMF1/EgtB/PvdO family nonheme iron enzyme [Bosea vestrisii]|uniref:SUMF1/EgtB/PvdO family nonheme iron enzyme n=1 Tax=Bosea vestrisii TaxID=151416 RepID=UPI0024DFC615|nr:SUMF1/EgtB/PvdO family nonheme iron enzyme [Bosea vestrisii]WID98965.1 SUMF1/EgtB/PvdO family nonheme iron enzyme [Bosea vestrisii]